jgi:hypothetical protein
MRGSGVLPAARTVTQEERLEDAFYFEADTAAKAGAGMLVLHLNSPGHAMVHDLGPLLAVLTTA